MFRLLALAIAALTLATPSLADTPAFEIGQVWTLRAPAAQTLRVQIGRIDVLRGRRVVSIAVVGAPCPPELGCETMAIGHMPFAEDALRGSVDHVESTGAAGAPNFEEGYQVWRSDERGGFWTVPVAEAIGMSLRSVARQAPPPAPQT